MHSTGLRHLDLRQITYFKAVVNEGTLIGAAKACGVSQPTISAQISAMEKFLGCTLFERTKKGASLTLQGDILLKYANRLLQEERLLLKELSQDNTIETVSFGASTGVTSFIIEHALSNVLTNHPQIKIDYVEDRASRLISLLENKKIDLAVISEPELGFEIPANIQKRRYYHEELLLAVGQNSKYAYSTQHVLVDDVKSENIIQFTDSHCLNRTIYDVLGKDVKSSMKVDQISSGLSLVAKNLGVMLMPIVSSLSHQRADVIYKRFENPVPRRPICLLRRRNDKLPKSAKALLQGIKRIPSLRSIGY